MRALLILVLLVLPATVPAAIEEIYRFDDPAKEDRYHKLIDELRCLVCQNQNLAASNADLAKDLRRKTYEMVRAGKTNEEIVAYMVQRYGDFVLYRPPFKATTAMLWIGPFLLLILGVVILLTIIRRQSRVREPELSSGDKQRAERLLRADDEEDTKS